MKHVKIKVSIDVTDANQVSALNSLLCAIGEHPSAVLLAAPAQELKAEDSDSQEEEPKRRTRRSKAEIEKAKAEIVDTEEDKDPKTEVADTEKAEVVEESNSDETYKLEDVRPLLAKKVKDHRQAIKDKLTEFEAPNLTALDSKHYGDFVEFLNSLK